MTPPTGEPLNVEVVNEWREAKNLLGTLSWWKRWKLRRTLNAIEAQMLAWWKQDAPEAEAAGIRVVTRHALVPSTTGGLADHIQWQEVV